MKHTISTTEAEVSPPKRKSKHTATSTSTTPSTLPSLEAFIANYVFNLIIQDDPTITKLAHEKNTSRKLIA
jgi:hypothetical protein